jgi:hypothetical protein
MKRYGWLIILFAGAGLLVWAFPGALYVPHMKDQVLYRHVVTD